MFEFSPSEWRQFTLTEKKMIIINRQYIADSSLTVKEVHNEMRRLLNWPFPTPKNRRTYEGQWSRLMAKMRTINAARVRPLTAKQKK